MYSKICTQVYIITTHHKKKKSLPFVSGKSSTTYSSTPCRGQPTPPAPNLPKAHHAGLTPPRLAGRPSRRTVAGKRFVASMTNHNQTSVSPKEVKALSHLSHRLTWPDRLLVWPGLPRSPLGADRGGGPKRSCRARVPRWDNHHRTWVGSPVLLAAAAAAAESYYLRFRLCSSCLRLPLVAPPTTGKKY